MKEFHGLVRILNGLSVDVASNTCSTTNTNAEEAGRERTPSSDHNPERHLLLLQLEIDSEVRYNTRLTW